MRYISLTVIAIILLLCGCKKTNTAYNFSYRVNGTVTQGTGVTYYDNTNSVFYINLNGVAGQQASLVWNYMPSISSINNLTTTTYSIAAHQLPPNYESASYSPPYSAAYYSTGGGVGGTITLTKNTGAGGLMSGTFSYTAINGSSPYDTVYITQGTFTDVPIDTL